MTTLMYLIYTLVEPHTYRKWEPIDTGKFGFDVSVRPSSRPPVQTLGVGVKNSKGWEGESHTSTLRFVLAQNFFTILGATNGVARVKI